MKKPAKKPRPPLFRVEFERRGYQLEIGGPIKARWTTRIIEERSEKIVLSTSSQLYSRKTDAVREARRLARAFKAGRVEIQA